LGIEHAVPHDRFQRRSFERAADGSHFRVGRADEWRDCFTPAQIARATQMIGDDLLRRFGEIADRATRRLRQHERERSGPEGVLLRVRK
jgi:hypothetical protein